MHSLTRPEDRGEPTSTGDSPFPDAYFTRVGLAKRLGITVRTLDRWHVLRSGPPRTVLGRTILYRKEAVMEWLEEHEREEPTPVRRRRCSS